LTPVLSLFTVFWCALLLFSPILAYGWNYYWCFLICTIFICPGGPWHDRPILSLSVLSFAVCTSALHSSRSLLVVSCAILIFLNCNYLKKVMFLVAFVCLLVSRISLLLTNLWIFGPLSYLNAWNWALQLTDSEYAECRSWSTSADNSCSRCLWHRWSRSHRPLLSSIKVGLQIQ